MGLVDDMINDAAEITANESDFGVEILLTSETNETATVNGFTAKVNIKEYNPSSDQFVMSQKVSVVVHENNILNANSNYPVRISDTSSKFYREVSMRDHLVSVKDSSGILKNYIVAENHPDETLGLITLILNNKD